MSTYRSFCFSHAPDWARVPVGSIASFHWEGETPFRPESRFQLCFVKNLGVYVRLWTNEPSPRCVCKTRAEPVYEDSCLEVFFAPWEAQDYLNVEMNAHGVFLAQIGPSREERVFLKTRTSLSPLVTPLACETGWGVECFLSCALIEAAFGAPFAAVPGTCRGNFYKCGDKTAVPHYAAFAPVGAMPPGFHAPQYFATIQIEEAESWNL